MVIYEWNTTLLKKFPRFLSQDLVFSSHQRASHERPTIALRARIQLPPSLPFVRRPRRLPESGTDKFRTPQVFNFVFWKRSPLYLKHEGFFARLAVCCYVCFSVRHGKRSICQQYYRKVSEREVFGQTRH